MTFKKNFMKKMTGIIFGLALSTVLILSVPVNAASSVTSNYKIDNGYASGFMFIFNGPWKGVNLIPLGLSTISGPAQ